MIVDVHTHLWDRPERLGPFLGAKINQRLAKRPWERMNVSATSLAQAADCVDVAFILGFVSRQLQADIPAPLIASYVKQDPSRYVGFAGVDPTADDVRDRLEEATGLGLQGLTLSPAAQGFHPTHSMAMRIYEWACKHKMPIMIDAANYQVAQASMEFGQPHLLDEVGREFPELRLIIGQVGHPWTDSTLSLIGKHNHFYADISSLSARPWQLYQVLQAAYQQDVIHRLLLGSGFPFATPQEVIASLYNVNGLARGTLMPSIPRQELKSIVQRDAFTCLGITPPPAVNSGSSRQTRPQEHEDAEVQNTSPADALLNAPSGQAQDQAQSQNQNKPQSGKPPFPSSKDAKAGNNR